MEDEPQFSLIRKVTGRCYTLPPFSHNQLAVNSGYCPSSGLPPLRDDFVKLGIAGFEIRSSLFTNHVDLVGIPRGIRLDPIVGWRKDLVVEGIR